jgi:DNA-directed RNA polymerase subunit RPC12/RpoP
MTDERKEWINVVEKFRNNINAVIECPACKMGILSFTDIAFDNNDINKGGERVIECPNCNKFEIVLYRYPPENWYTKNTL